MYSIFFPSPSIKWWLIHFIFHQVQLDITPKIEGVLKIIGVQWRLSGSVTGYRYFGVDAKKKYKQGTRVSRQSPSNNLNFVVIKVPGFSMSLPFVLISVY